MYQLDFEQIQEIVYEARANFFKSLDIILKELNIKENVKTMKDESKVEDKKQTMTKARHFYSGPFFGYYSRKTPNKP